ncbi:Glycosidase [Amphibacillus marinus]|uniref:Glycosidase n=1 Tax=Amphibacillus marinus TaxID=872970 RepID=A0A1H8MVK9_9BACI|nr:glycoside hydrolase family 13 protein [Amphibacillus marinus]SEO21319.1 Glycosidase [Amphibacillus marinus]
MNTAALYHRPESEYAYLYEKGHFHIRMRTQLGDVTRVELLSGDPYTLHSDEWFRDGVAMEKVYSTNLHDYWLIDTNEPTNRISYGFRVVGEDGVEVFFSDQGVQPFEASLLREANAYFRMPYVHEIDAFKAPTWVRDTIWYQIFPERFSNGDATLNPENTLAWEEKANPGRDDFYGGDLQGIINNLDYLKELGINGLYLCPIFKAASNHKYDTIDYYEIDPAFGNKATFKKLVKEAHDRGIKIMLDAVFNHLGWHSPQWQDVLAHQERSEYKDWFHIHEFPVKNLGDLTTDEMENVGVVNYETFAFTGHMPKLNTANPKVQAYLLDIATYWIKEFDIDAWRLDVANEVDHTFWKQFYKETTSIKSDLYILGEIWHSSQSWLNGDEFHAVMNYAYTNNIENYFFNNTLTPMQMVAGLNTQLMLYRQQTTEVMFNLLDSHDTARILTKANGNKARVKAALFFMFTQTGTPCIYYGTEIGLDGGNDPDCRKCMVWDTERQDLDMLNFTKDMIRFRKRYAEILTYGKVEWHDLRDDEQVIGYKRTLGNETLIFYFNQSKEKVKLDRLLENADIQLSINLAQDEEGLTLQEDGFVACYHVKGDKSE